MGAGQPRMEGRAAGGAAQPARSTTSTFHSLLLYYPHFSTALQGKQTISYDATRLSEGERAGEGAR